MTTPAVLMMIVAMLLLWGGLAASIVFLRARPQVILEDPDLALDERAQTPHPDRDL